MSSTDDKNKLLGFRRILQVRKIGLHSETVGYFRVILKSLHNHLLYFTLVINVYSCDENMFSKPNSIKYIVLHFSKSEKSVFGLINSACGVFINLI